MPTAVSLPRPERGPFGTSRRTALLAAVFACVATLSPAAPLEARPLASRSGPAGATLFHPIPSARSGLTMKNLYADPKMWGERNQEFTLGAIGTGVAVGDYDGDGRPDILLVNKTGRNRLYRNRGDWTFEDVTEAAGLAGANSWTDRVKRWVGLSDADAAPSPEIWKQGASFVDIDNDGWLDAYICRFGAPNLLYVNQRDGTFREEAAARGLALVDSSGMGAFCDYDRDGWLDVYVQTNLLNAAARPNGQRDYLLRNTGDGRFVDVTEAAGISGDNLAHSATWWDFDEDGWPDLYVANDFAAPDRLYRNNGDGTFTNVIDRVLPCMPYSAMGADLGDIDNDSRIDFFVADMAATSHEKDQRGMAHSRILNHESKQEGGTPQYSRNTLYLNTGMGRCLEVAYLTGLAATDWTWSVRFEDLDNDGRLDVHVTNGMNREYNNADLRDRIVLAGSLAERIRLVRESPPLTEANLAYRNLGELKFEEVGRAWGLDQVGISFGAAFGDFDGDGDLDLVYANYDEEPTLLRNDSTTGHRLLVDLRGTRSNRFGVGAVVEIETATTRQVRQLVLARGYLSTSEPMVHFGLGDDAMVHRLTVRWPSGHVQTFQDIAADQRLTITEPAEPPPRPTDPVSPTPEYVEIAETAGLAHVATESSLDRPTQPLTPILLNRVGPAAAAGDLDGDGRDDLVVGATSGAPARVYLATAEARFLPANAPTGPGAAARLPDGPLLLFDADGNGTLDLLVTKAGTLLPAGSSGYQPLLWLNDGNARWRPADAAALPALPISAGAAVAADFDRDGWVDVFIGGRVVPGRYPLPAPSALLRNTGGAFVDATADLAPDLATSGLVTAALASDVDGDGWIDLLVAYEWGPVRFWRNDRGRRFIDQTAEFGFAAAGNGWWTSLVSGDFNGDGRIDYLAGNAGLNTPYRATATEPALLFVGDFRGNGQSQLIEAYYEAGQLYPRRTRKELGTIIPTVLRRYPQDSTYARATLEQILGAERLAGAQRFAATELQHGIFHAQPDGRYRFVPLPRETQHAPLQGAVAMDLDGDGCAEVFAAQNSFAPWAERFSGGLGLILRRARDGVLRPVDAARTGWIIPGNAKSLVLLDSDGAPNFFVTRNHDRALLFRQPPMAAGRPWRLVLRGPRGNPTAIGARVTVEYADGRRSVAEVCAGSGYHAQSSATLFFGPGLDAANPPHRVSVRWPSGVTSTHPVPQAAATLSLSAAP